ncbi:hypothetical protein HOL21_00405 [Candidatus Woesearchaeota archaeon]|jgi:hypothetical protein|nr:hypothetical protein [Candidatus Woesearchaeota archaeon]MBT5396658.1 hypothetical protein [Candidatus Woesearchaeota archaeon]MBT5924262.1 hypothetical protein [Candidatus Woesearchaeota archaeon]MBT6367555.1 hypothetical protein [Candidatus Woesearchaeota archaeon]MBT7763054.1 hypothetical protein [Candidatus Woesearchaeota archaeon]
MAYIRTKNINKNSYAYVVESTKTAKGPRQKVKQYLGRVYETTKSNNINKSVITAKNKTDFLQQLITKELDKNGFSQQGSHLKLDTVVFLPKSLTLQKKKKHVVVKLNEGYLCNHTVNNIKKFARTQDIAKDGFKLAKLLLDAGLPISEEEFISFYKLH